MSAKNPEPVPPLAAEARNELQRCLRVFKSFEHADKALAVLENLEQLQAERERAAGAALSALVDAQAQLEQVTGNLSASVADARQAKAQAEQEAAGLVAEAKEQAAQVTAAAAAEVDAARVDLDTLNAGVADAMATLSALAAELASANETIAKAARLREAMAGA